MHFGHDSYIRLIKHNLQDFPQNPYSCNESLIEIGYSVFVEECFTCVMYEQLRIDWSSLLCCCAKASLVSPQNAAYTNLPALLNVTIFPV